MTFTIRVDWSKAITPPAVAMRRLLKVLLRTYNARCLEARLEDEPTEVALLHEALAMIDGGDVIPADLLERAVAGVRAADPGLGVPENN